MTVTDGDRSDEKPTATSAGREDEQPSAGRVRPSSAREGIETKGGDDGSNGGGDDKSYGGGGGNGFPPWMQATALVVASLLMAAGLFAWWQAAHEETTDLAGVRDSALISATEKIETMNSLDYRDVDEGLGAWAAVTTGTLHDQLVDIADEQRKLLADQKKISTGKVVDAAVLDLTEETATVIASLEITVKDDKDASAEPTVKRNRFSADLVKVDGDWLVENLVQVPVNIS